jgi:hypothetical protein
LRNRSATGSSGIQQLVVPRAQVDFRDVLHAEPRQHVTDLGAVLGGVQIVIALQDYLKSIKLRRISAQY